MRHRTAPAAAAAVLLITAAVPAAAQQGAPPALPVTVATPLSKHVTTWDDYWGRFEAVQTVEVRPRVSGFIEQIHFKDGQIVKTGDLLFTIDKRPFEIAAESARADIARAKAQVQLGESEVARATPLARTGATTVRELETRQSNLGVARASLQAAEATLKSAELNLQWAEVTAPIDGRVSDRKVDVGNLVSGGQTGTATVLTNIVSIDPIHFVFDGSESDYLHYARLQQSGQRESSRTAANPVSIKLADEDGWKHEGKMDFVDNQISQRSGTIRARALVDNKDGILLPGLFGRLRLFGGDIDALLIPDSAIVSDQAKKIVFVVGADHVIAGKEVELGPIIDGLRVVKKGLDANDQIVIEGLSNPAVRPGAKVEPKTGEIKTAAK